MIAALEKVKEMPQHTGRLKFRRFRLQDRELLKRFAETFSPQSCEYNFANLYTWQDVHDISWTLYQGRLLIYDGLSKKAYMPLGEDFFPEDLVVLSLHLEKEGLRPDFGLVTEKYLETYPGVNAYYTVETQRDAAEYIYDVNHLVELSGVKLHKKKNLIAQFKKYYPDFEVHNMDDEYQKKALEFTKALLDKRETRSATLDQEFHAIQMSFAAFDELNLDGLALTLDGQLIGYAVFSRISESTYDIQFEKADPQFKGAGQVINHETAKYLKGKCLFVNREQDLGIKGLRQAKLSYDPVELWTPYGLKFNPPN